MRENSWFLQLSTGGILGPLPEGELLTYIGNRFVTENTLAYSTTLSTWEPLGTLPHFQNLWPKFPSFAKKNLPGPRKYLQVRRARAKEKEEKNFIAPLKTPPEEISPPPLEMVEPTVENLSPPINITPLPAQTQEQESIPQTAPSELPLEEPSEENRTFESLSPAISKLLQETLPLRPDIPETRFSLRPAPYEEWFSFKRNIEKETIDAPTVRLKDVENISSSPQKEGEIHIRKKTLLWIAYALLFLTLSVALTIYIKKTRVVKELPLPLPSSPVVQPRETSDPISPLKAPTRPRRKSPSWSPPA